MAPLLTAVALVFAGFAMVSNAHQSSPFRTIPHQLTMKRCSQLIHNFIHNGGSG
jgi:hypothetical protein